MQKIFKIFNSKVGVVLAIIFLASAVGALALYPREIDSAHADQGCSPTFSTPIFNPYTIDHNGAPCYDYPFMRAKVIRNGQELGDWQGDTENNVLNVQAGDQIEFVLYVHNGAVVGGPAATGEVVSAQIDSNNSIGHQVNAQVTANNVSTPLNGTMWINTPDNTTVSVVTNDARLSQQWYANTGVIGNPTFQGSLNFVNGSASLPDQPACFGFTRFIYFSLQVTAQTKQPVNPPTPSNFNLSVTPNAVCVNSKSNLDITNATSDLNGKQVFWNSTFNGADTGEHLSGYGQFVSNGSFRGQTGIWKDGTAGSWTKTASFVDDSGNVIASQTASFTVLPLSDPACGGTPPPPASYSFNLSVSNPPICANYGAPTFSVTNASSGLYGKQIYWSSTFNGQSTGENKDGYSQYINNSGSWSGVGSVFNSNQVGNWTKTASFVDDSGNVIASQTASFTVLPLSDSACGGTPPPPASYSFNLSVSNPPICANYGAPTFSVTNASSGLFGKQIYWSSTFNGQSTGENKDGYSQYINNSGSWSGVGSVFNSNQVGNWTKTASFVDGNGNVIASQTVSFTVLPTNDPSCGGTTPPPASYGFNLSITPNQVCVNAQSSVSITNATSNLNGKQIFWTSTLNGSNTGERLSGYNQFINNGSYSGQTGTWTASEAGNWIKTASFVDGNGNVLASQTANFTVLPLSNSACGGTTPPQTYSFNLSITPNQVCVNTQSSVAITNATSNLNGKQVFWTSTLNGQSTGENLSGYNQFINNGSYSGQTSTWTASEVGSWTKTASFVDANGNVIASQTTGFTVLPLSNSACGGTPPTQDLHRYGQRDCFRYRFGQLFQRHFGLGQCQRFGFRHRDQQY